jgi:hypothetical protein
MKGERPNTTTILIDIRYYGSQNSFEEFYGENISYQEIEQSSYVEFKEEMFERINREIKFRKYGRIGPVLTIKADMTKNEVEAFRVILDRNEIKLLHNWIVSNVTIITDRLPDSSSSCEDDDDLGEKEENEDI